MSNFEFHATSPAVTGEYMGGYVPHVESDSAYDVDGIDVLFDGAPANLSEWSAVTGKTRQQGYRGAIMHACEYADDASVREWVCDAGGDQCAIAEEGECEHYDATYGEQRWCDSCDDATYSRNYPSPS